MFFSSNLAYHSLCQTLTEPLFISGDIDRYNRQAEDESCKYLISCHGEWGWGAACACAGADAGRRSSRPLSASQPLPLTRATMLTEPRSQGTRGLGVPWRSPGQRGAAVRRGPLRPVKRTEVQPPPTQDAPRSEAEELQECWNLRSRSNSLFYAYKTRRDGVLATHKASTSSTGPAQDCHTPS